MIVANKPKIFLSIQASDTTIIHRGGMTGLWMTLKQLAKKFPTPAERPGDLTWDLTPTSISLNWQGQDLPVLDWLLKKSFQINQQGLISFTGLNSSSMDLINQIHIHQSINDTFLRHNKFYKKEKVTSELFNIKNNQIVLEYKALKWYIHQTFAEKLCDQSGYLIEDYVKIVSWLYPGATVRHARLNQITKIEEKVEYALALLFLSLVCQYYILESDYIQNHNKRLTKYLIVIPEINNLETAALRRWNLQNIKYQDCYVTNLGEAALKYYYYTQSSNSPRDNECCQILQYDKPNKKSQQRALVNIQDFTITYKAIKDYQFVQDYFQENRVFPDREKSEFTVKVNSIRAIIANNLAHNLPWWTNFWEIIYQGNQLGDLAKQLAFNHKGLFAMIEQDKELENYRDFICAFHGALRKIYAKIYGRTKKGEIPRIEREYERIRGELSRCYDQQSLEDFLSDFLARAGLNAALYEQWEEILPLIFSEIDWRKTRNLALIALASYKPQKFSLRNVPIKFWNVLVRINPQAAILFLYKQSIIEVFQEIAENIEEY